MTLLGEVVTAMVTPFDKNNNIDFEQVEKLSRFLIENGTETVLVSGTTGESPTLESDEVKELVSVVKNAVGSKAKLLVGAGTNNTDKSVIIAKEIEKAGADAILTVVPYYNKPSQEGMKAHFGAVAINVDIPVVMYNIQSRTGVNMLPETIAELAKEFKNIKAVKQSHPDMDLVTEIMNKTPDDFEIYCGDDSLTLPMLSIGACGVISVASHLIGSKIKEMISAYKNGKIEEAAKIHRACYPIFKGLFIAPNPTPLKYALKELGILKNDIVRLPLLPIENKKQEIIRLLLKDNASLMPAKVN